MAGTRRAGVHVGAEADATIFSFQAVKNLPTADGGMICFRSADDDRRARKLAWLGIDRNTFDRTMSHAAQKWRYDVEELGYKYHGNSIMAAIGLVQLRYLERDNDARRQIAERYRERLTGSPAVALIPIPADCQSSTHLFAIRVRDRDALLAALNERGVFPGVHYRDNTEYALYRAARGTCPRAARASSELISLPLHTRLSSADVERVADLVSSLTSVAPKTAPEALRHVLHPPTLGP